MPMLPNSNFINIWQGCGATRSLIYACSVPRMDSHCGTSTISHLAKSGLTSVQGIYLTDEKTHGHAQTSVWMFIAAVFKITTHCKQLRCPSMGEWMSKLGYSHANKQATKFGSKESHSWAGISCNEAHCPTWQLFDTHDHEHMRNTKDYWEANCRSFLL